MSFSQVSSFKRRENFNTHDFSTRGTSTKNLVHLEVEREGERTQERAGVGIGVAEESCKSLNFFIVVAIVIKEFDVTPICL